MFLEFIKSIIENSYDLFLNYSIWIVMGLLIITILRGLLSRERISEFFGNRNISTLAYSILSSLIIPGFSTATSVISLGLYELGASLGSSISYLVASSLLNPLYLFLSFYILGPDITRINIFIGILLAVFLGIIGNLIEDKKVIIESHQDKSYDLGHRIKDSFSWLNTDFGPRICRVFIIGFILTSIVKFSMPNGDLQASLIDPKKLSIQVVSQKSTLMYIDTVGYLPYAAGLFISNRSPGLIISFILFGFASNFTNILAYIKYFGKKAMVIICLSVGATAIILGNLVNKLIGPKVNYIFDFDEMGIRAAEINSLFDAFPNTIKYIACIIFIYFFLKSIVIPIKKLKVRHR